MSLKPSSALLGREEETKKLLELVVSGNIVVLKGDYGTGKTSLLFFLRELYNENKEYSLEYHSLAHGFEALKQGFSENTAVEKKRILLLDEGDLLAAEHTVYLKNVFENELLHSIVLACPNKSVLPANGFRERVSETIELQRLHEKELCRIFQARSRGRLPLNEKALAVICGESNGNPARFLLYCRKACIEAFVKKKRLSAEEVKKLLGSYREECRGKHSARETAFMGLSPLQNKILKQLAKRQMNLEEISHSTGSSIGTIGKQLSILSMHSKKHYLKKRGILSPLVEKDKSGQKTLYLLSRDGKDFASRIA